MHLDEAISQLGKALNKRSQDFYALEQFMKAQQSRIEDLNNKLAKANGIKEITDNLEEYESLIISRGENMEYKTYQLRYQKLIPEGPIFPMEDLFHRAQKPELRSHAVVIPDDHISINKNKVMEFLVEARRKANPTNKV